MTDRTDEIRQRCDAATAEPWKAVEHGNTVKSHAIVAVNKDVSIVPVASGISPQTGNAAFIAHAREDIPYLLGEIDRLNALHKREIIITGEYAQRVIDLTARAERAERERDEYRAALQNWHEDGTQEAGKGATE